MENKGVDLGFLCLLLFDVVLESRTVAIVESITFKFKHVVPDLTKDGDRTHSQMVAVVNVVDVWILGAIHAHRLFG